LRLTAHHPKAIGAVLAEFGQIYDQELRSCIIGRDEVEGANLIINTKKLPIDGRQFLAKRHLHLEQLFPEAELMPGAKELTAYFKKHDIPMAVATSSVKEAVQLKLRKHQEWFQVFSFVITGDDEQVKQGKPAPDIFLAAARGIGVDPAHCLIFEDSPSGAEAGANAGGIVVAVPDPIMPHERYPRAQLILQSLLEFSPEIFGLPPFL